MKGLEEEVRNIKERVSYKEKRKTQSDRERELVRYIRFKPSDSISSEASIWF